MMNCIVFPSTVTDAVLFFAIYSFAGWIVEVIYRSWTQKRFVNAGFLFGPFVPLYGMGALLVLALGSLLNACHPVLFIIAVGIVLTVLEYIIGFASEKIIGLKLWDYSTNRFNLHGRICLSFSVAWAIFAYALAMLVHPHVVEGVKTLEAHTATAVATAFLAYYAFDLSASTISAFGFKRKIADLMANFTARSDAEIQSIIASLGRLLRSFPHLHKYLDGNLRESMKMRLNNIMTIVSSQAVDELKKRKPRDKEYIDLVKDILMNEEFKKLKEFYHHNSSIYEHARRVSFLSYKICKYLNLDYRAAARGGLLHDFFLYDWRNHTEPELAEEKFHGLHHPSIALSNAMKHFKITEKEKDIIVKHMWPLTLIPPRYRESFVVTFVDKYLSSAEFLSEYAKKSAFLKDRKL